MHGSPEERYSSLSCPFTPVTTKINETADSSTTPIPASDWDGVVPPPVPFTIPYQPRAGMAIDWLLILKNPPSSLSYIRGGHYVSRPIFCVFYSIISRSFQIINVEKLPLI
jgi:hypothetical protein